MVTAARIRLLAGLLGFTLLGIAALASTVLVARPALADWLTVRRGGTNAIIGAAQSALASRAWGAVYKPKVKKGHRLAGLRIEYAHRPRPVKKGQPRAYDCTVVIRGCKGGVAGVAVVGGAVVGGAVGGAAVWARRPGEKTAKATGKALMARLATLDAPLVLFAMAPLAFLFDTKLEGEFGGTAVLRLTPKYAGLAGLGNGKLGIGKKSLFPEMAEVGSGDGKDDIKLAFIGVRTIRGQQIPDGIRLMRANGAAIVDFERISLKLGKAAKTLRFGRASLR